MCANPEPEEPVRHFDRDRTVVQADPRRPEIIEFLEVEGRMLGIGLKQFERLVCGSLHVRWQAGSGPRRQALRVCHIFAERPAA